ncbi:MAG: hypothetical protein V4494_03760 [Chlamydiota bacterium]
MVLNPSLSPSDFFSLTVPVLRGKTWKDRHLLPDVSGLFPEKSFGEIGLGWHEEGITIGGHVHKALDDPDKDFLEVFFDTRDLKTAGFPTKFCHHFLIVPQDGGSREVTRFRTEDAHPLCDSCELDVTFHTTSSSYTIQAFIPAHCLYGYDPHSFKRMGFTYKLHRKMKEPQHFSVSSNYYGIDQQPSLWSSLKLV